MHLYKRVCVIWPDHLYMAVNIVLSQLLLNRGSYFSRDSLTLGKEYEVHGSNVALVRFLSYKFKIETVVN